MSLAQLVGRGDTCFRPPSPPSAALIMEQFTRNFTYCIHKFDSVMYIYQVKTCVGPPLQKFYICAPHMSK